MGKLRIINKTGDTTVKWDTDEKEAVEEAERIFDETRKRGATAFNLVPGADPVKIERFDPEADQIVMVPRIAGGI